MKHWTLAFVILISAAAAQTPPSPSASLLAGDPVVADSSSGAWQEAKPGERMFFPRDMFWGWAELNLAPPHNEVDPNLCAGNAGAYGGANAPCSMFARYVLSGVLEVRPFGRGPLRRFMLFGAPTFLFGKNVPKTLYTWSPDAIGIEHSLGAGIYLDKGFEFRITQHYLFDRLGARDTNLGLADLGNNGPRVVLVTLGSVLPAVALHPAGERVRDMIARLAAAPGFIWVDCQSRKDVMCFADFDPVSGVGVDAGSNGRNPVLWRISFRDLIAPKNYNRFRWNHFRVHYQYIMGAERRGPYDYTLLVGGPVAILQWPERARDLLTAFADAGHF